MGKEGREGGVSLDVSHHMFIQTCVYVCGGSRGSHSYTLVFVLGYNYNSIVVRGESVILHHFT